MKEIKICKKNKSETKKPRLKNTCRVFLIGDIVDSLVSKVSQAVKKDH